MNSDTEEPLSSLAEELQMFFNQGAHDLKNAFQSMQLWLDTDQELDRAQAVHLLRELETYYTDKIDSLRHSFDELQTVRTGTAPTTNVNVASVVMTVLDKMKDRLERSAQVKTELNAEVTLRYSEEHLGQAVYALLDNAWRYRDFQRPLTIVVTADADEREAYIIVQDNGIGIDMERYGEQLFTPFVRCTDQSEGQGMSLHLVSVMAEANGGRVAISSQLSQGTTVKLYLPLNGHST